MLIDILAKAKELDEKGRIDSALDIIFDSIDDALLENDFQIVDDLLSKIKIEEYSENILIGILTITLPAKSYLLNRSKFFIDIEKYLRDNDMLEDGLLRGLD